jgi:CheY-like chemotaxis protein
VTLTSSIAEAQEMLSFVRCKAAGPSAVLVAEALLGHRSAAFRADLAARFPDLAWVPVRADIDLDWLQGWVEQMVARPPRAKRRCLDILFVEEDQRVRQEVTRRLSEQGDRVVACASIAQARQESDSGAKFDVLIAPAIAGTSEGISLFLVAKKQRPELRWVVSARAPAKQPARATLSEIARLRRAST